MHHWTSRWVALVLLQVAACVWAGPQDDLYKAAEKGDRAAASRAMKAGARADAPDGDGWTALVFAAAAGKSDLVKLLLAEKADPNAMTNDGQTPLVAAVVAGSRDAVKALLDAGARVSTTLPSGKTAIDLARSRGRGDLVALLEVGPSNAAAAGSPNAAMQAANGSGVDVMVIRAFLTEQRQQDQKRAAVQVQRQDIDRRLQSAQAAKSQQQRQAVERYESCKSTLEVCQADCASKGSVKRLGALLGGVAVARKGGSTTQAEDAIRASGDEEESCKAACDSQHACEARQP